MNEIQNRWSNEWDRFFINISRLVSWKVRIRRDAEYATPLEKLMFQATELLINDTTKNELGRALEECEQEDDGTVTLEMLLSKIMYVSDKIQRRISSEPEIPTRRVIAVVQLTDQKEALIVEPSDPSADEEFDDAKTGKGSIESFFGKKFSPGTNKILKIVNEVLSLAKGGF